MCCEETETGSALTCKFIHNNTNGRPFVYHFGFMKAAGCDYSIDVAREDHRVRDAHMRESIPSLKSRLMIYVGLSDSFKAFVSS